MKESGLCLQMMEVSVALLHPGYQATKDLSGDEYSTRSMIIPVTKMPMTTYAYA